MLRHCRSAKAAAYAGHNTASTFLPRSMTLRAALSAEIPEPFRVHSGLRGQSLPPGARIRPMSEADLPGVLAIQAEAYAGADFAPEQPAVYRDRMALAPDLCLVATDAGGTLLGYLVSHPWHTGEPPPLDTELGALPPASGCWYLHDCAVAAQAHGQGVAAVLYQTAQATAQARGLRSAALVAVGNAAGYWARVGYGAQERPELAAKLSGYGRGARYMARAL